MAYQVILPKMGLTMTEGTIEEWFVKEGDKVTVEQELCEVSTDKLSNKIKSKEDGILRKVFVEEGETIDVFTAIAIIANEGDDISELMP